MAVHPDQMAPGERAAWANGYDAGKPVWRPMSEAPKDKEILVRRHNDICYEYDLVHWESHFPKYPWCSTSGSDNAYPEGRLDDWMLIPE